MSCDKQLIDLETRIKEMKKQGKPILDDKAKQAIEKAYQSILQKGDDARISSGPNGSVKVYEVHTKLVLDTAKI